jgi:hypothetical protein
MRGFLAGATVGSAAGPRPAADEEAPLNLDGSVTECNRLLILCNVLGSCNEQPTAGGLTGPSRKMNGR